MKSKATYYPVDSLITAQISHLTSTGNTTITKVALLDGKEARTSISPKDSSIWIKELEAFRDLAVINKPINKDLYTVEDGLKDSKSNLSVKSFTSKKSLPVEYLKVFYEGKLSRLRKLEAKFHESNVMYNGTRYLTIEFDDIRQVPTMTYYSIAGGQKMFLGDTVQYRMNAVVSISN